MKRTIITSAFALTVLFANAQLKVYSGGKTYIGGTSTTPNAVLSVGAAGSTTDESYFYNSQTANYTTGVNATIANPTSQNGICVNGRLTHSGGIAYGMFGSSYNSTAQSSGRAFGVLGQAGNASTGYNYGVFGSLLGSNNGAGIFASVGGFNTQVPAQYAAYIDGQLRTTHDSPLKPTSGSWSGASDSRVKKNITDFKDGLNVIRNIKPVNYEFNGMGGLPTGKTNIGVIAQDVQKVAPYCIGKARIIVDRKS